MASRGLGTLTLDLIAKTGGFTDPLDKAARNAKKNSDSISGSAASIGKSMGLAAGALAAVAATAVFATIVKETQEAQKEQAQLAAALDSTGMAAGFTQKSLNDMANTMAKGLGLDDGDITKAQTALLAFTNIAGDQFPKAMQAAADIAARKGIEIGDAAQLIGKALDSPTKGMAALSKQGIRFSEDQTRVIKSLEDTGRAAEAQNIILDELEKKFGGAAKAARDTFPGALAGLQAALKNVLTGDNGSLAGAATAVNELTDTLNDPQVAAGIGSLVSGFTAIASSVVIATAKTASFIAQGPAFFKFLAGSVDTGSIGQTVDRLGELEVAIAEINKKRDEGIRLSAGEYAELGQLQKQQRELTKVVDDHNASILKAADDQKAAAVASKEMAAANAQNAEASERAKKAEDERNRVIQENAKYVKDRLAALKLEVETLGMSSQQMEIYNLRLRGAGTSSIDAANAAMSAVETYKKIQKDMAELEGLSGPAAPTGGPSDRLDELTKKYASEREIEMSAYKQKLDDFKEISDLQGGLTAEQNSKLEAIQQEHQDKMRAIDTAGLQAKLQGTQQALSSISTLMNTESKKLFEIGKAGAIANASISMHDGVMKAWALGPILGPILAPLVAVAGAANILSIKNTKFGGSGGGSPAVSAPASPGGTGFQSSQASSTRDVYLHGIDPNQLYSGSSILSLLNNELMNGGRLAGVGA